MACTPGLFGPCVGSLTAKMVRKPIEQGKLAISIDTLLHINMKSQKKGVIFLRGVSLIKEALWRLVQEDASLDRFPLRVWKPCSNASFNLEGRRFQTEHLTKCLANSRCKPHPLSGHLGCQIPNSLTCGKKWKPPKRQLKPTTLRGGPTKPLKNPET